MRSAMRVAAGWGRRAPPSTGVAAKAGAAQYEAHSGKEVFARRNSSFFVGIAPLYSISDAPANPAVLTLNIVAGVRRLDGFRAILDKKVKNRETTIGKFPALALLHWGRCRPLWPLARCRSRRRRREGTVTRPPSISAFFRLSAGRGKFLTQGH